MDVLSELRDWVDAEYRFALEHRTAARQCEDYRAGERHDSYGMAMAKVLHRIADVSRQQETPHRSEVAKIYSVRRTHSVDWPNIKENELSQEVQTGSTHGSAATDAADGSTLCVRQADRLHRAATRFRLLAISLDACGRGDRANQARAWAEELESEAEQLRAEKPATQANEG